MFSLRTNFGFIKIWNIIYIFVYFAEKILFYRLKLTCKFIINICFRILNLINNFSMNLFFLCHKLRYYDQNPNK